MIALSSCEAEFYGLVTGVRETLGEQSIALDRGIMIGIQMRMDATAGAAIGSRRGLGRVKHLNTVFLWVQEFVTSGKIKISKVHTTENYADILTKAVSGPLLMAMMTSMKFRFLDGRSRMALTA